MKAAKRHDKYAKCGWEACKESGKHPAPKSPENLQELQYYCLEHIREYNKSWNFFSNMNQNDMEAFRVDSIYGHRPTSRMGVNNAKNINTETLRAKIFDEFGFNNQKEETKKLPEGELKSLKILGFNNVVSLDKIKSRFKDLAKKYHPDMNAGAESEEFKIINQAYSYLKELYKGQ